MNNSYSYTGRSVGYPVVSSSSISNAEGSYTYETEKGQTASTTNNIYGIYDMSGGSKEYVMGITGFSSDKPVTGKVDVRTTDKKLLYYPSGLAGYYNNGTATGGTPIPDPKYVDMYSFDSNSNATHSRGKLGDASKECLISYGSTTGGWYNDGVGFPFSNNGGLINRGDSYSAVKYAGIFSSGYKPGYADSVATSRTVISEL